MICALPNDYYRLRIMSNHGTRRMFTKCLIQESLLFRSDACISVAYIIFFIRIRCCMCVIVLIFLLLFVVSFLGLLSCTFSHIVSHSVGVCESFFLPLIPSTFFPHRQICFSYNCFVDIAEHEPNNIVYQLHSSTNSAVCTM